MKPLLQRTISPVDGSVYVEREFASDQAIEAALAKAVSAQRAWKQVLVAERAAICRRMADWCVANADQLGEELTWQIGRPIAQSPGEIRGGFHERVNYMSGIAEETLADLAVEKKAGFQRFIRREPLGVVLVLAPWNYPWLTSVNAVVPALLAGNTVVLKMAQQTPLVAERYRQAFAAAGLPDGAFQFLHIDHESAARVRPRLGRWCAPRPPTACALRSAMPSTRGRGRFLTRKRTGKARRTSRRKSSSTSITAWR